jgi:hypothetical protein
MADPPAMTSVHQQEGHGQLGYSHTFKYFVLNDQHILTSIFTIKLKIVFPGLFSRVFSCVRVTCVHFNPEDKRCWEQGALCWELTLSWLCDFGVVKKSPSFWIGDNFITRRHLSMSGDIYVTRGLPASTGEDRDIAKPPAVARTAPQHTYPARKSSALREKPGGATLVIERSPCIHPQHSKE